MLRTRTAFVLALIVSAGIVAPGDESVRAAVLDVNDASAPSPDDVARLLAEENARVKLVEALTPAVCCVFGKDHRAGGGSGVLIDPAGYGLTNFHVVVGMLATRIGEIGLPDGTTREIEILGVDPGGDVAVFRIRNDVARPPSAGAQPQLNGAQPPSAVSPSDSRSPPAWPAAPLGDSDRLAVGDPVLAMGNPFGLAEDYTPTVTSGIISGLHRFQPGVRGALVYTDCIQVDASINPGNSGGPLFDTRGRLIGINGRITIEERGRINVGTGFAIPINQIKRFLPMLRAGLVTPHAGAGFTVADAGDRVIVDRIERESAAYQSGLRPGDEVVQFGGRTLSCANDFLNMLGSFPGGWPVETVYRRDGQIRRFSMRAESLPLPNMASKRPRHGQAAFDPFADHPITEAANRRAVRRAFGRFHDRMGGREAVAAIESIEWSGRRTPATDLGGDGEPIRRIEKRSALPEVDAALGLEELERSIRWGLIDCQTDPADAGFRVVASDEIAGAIAVVLQRKAGGVTYRVSFDDENGRLLAVHFPQAPDGPQIRVEYDDDRRAGAVRLPATRRVYRDDELIEEFRFDRIEAVFSEPRPFLPVRDRLSPSRDRFSPSRDRLSPSRDREGAGSNRPQPVTPRAKKIKAPHLIGAAPDAQTGRTRRLDEASRNPVQSVFDRAAPCVVKLYGPAAGRERGYGVGVIVSPDGNVLTTLSIMVKLRGVQVVLHDGRRIQGRLVRSDDVRQLALVKIDAAELPYLTPEADADARVGDTVVALGNWFKLADGPEPVSVTAGILALRTHLEARRLAQEFEYEGPVLVIDAITANPGAPGGPLLDVRGRFIGLIGKIIEGAGTNTRLNYAVPADVLTDFLDATHVQPVAGSPARGAAQTHPGSDAPAGQSDQDSEGQPYVGIKLARLGYRHVSAFVDRVRPGSPAARAGIRADDLILAIDGRRIADADEYEEALARLLPGQRVLFTVKRGDEIRSIHVEVGAAP